MEPEHLSQTIPKSAKHSNAVRTRQARTGMLS